MWRRKHNRRRAMSATCLSSRHASRVGGGVSFLASSLVSPFGPSLLACLVCPSDLIVLSVYHLTRSSPARLIRSPRVPLLASSVRLSHRLIGSPLTSYRLAPRIIDKRGGEKMRSSSAGGHRRRMADGGRCRGCLLASDGVGRSSAVDGGGRVACLSWGVLPLDVWRCRRRRTVWAWAWLLACPGGGGDGWDGSVISSSHLIGSSNRLRFSPGSSHRLGSWIIPSTGSWLLFHFSLTPSRLLFSACLPWLVPPSPAGGCAGCGMACGGGRAGCLHAFSSPVPLSRCRSFAHCYTPRVARAVVPARGVVGHFMGYFCRLLVGVGVFKYMPLNRILWLLTGIFGDSVRCHFSALPVASSSLICSVSCHLSAAASWRWCGCFPAVSW